MTAVNRTRFSDLPSRMWGLPLDHRGFPVPWFVFWKDGVPHFPIADSRKAELAYRRNLCWVCGHELQRIKAFVIGPMCTINRTSSEPPSHLECARFSARHCPFLANPRMKRVPEGKRPSGNSPGGEAILRNPGVTAVWITKRFKRYDDGRGGLLYEIGRAANVEWYAEGQQASRDQVMHSITTGLPFLEEAARNDPNYTVEECLAELELRKQQAFKLLPAQ